ncbi:MAG: hypothetical protein GC153_12005 [Alphaproteobacteria bacterium]|nr:hypothetical protein [Alphaproteobacteria bacterium]
MGESDAGSVRVKRRGVRASRVKLERALAESDLRRKTQAALAERIADLEELEAAPKDLVSKVFRERFVDPQTLERVARALGVEAGTLYREENGAGADGRPRPAAAAPTPPSLSISRREIVIGAASLGVVLVMGFVFAAMATGPSGPWCGLREAIERPHAAQDRLGVVIARFAGDPQNRAQQYLAANLAADPNLAPYLSVLASCARPRWSGPGELQRKLEAVRASGRKALTRAGAHVMLWGETQGDDIVVRFISTRRDASPIAVEIAGRPLKVTERNLEVRLPLGRPSESLADLKRLTLDLITTDDHGLSRLRSQAMQSYKSSADWLRAAVVSQRNLRRTLDRRSEPQRWAAASMQLCYDLRLLGDYETSAERYRQAIEACDEALRARPQERFPHDWAAAQINRASSLLRLHYFASDRQGALDYLSRAENALLEVVGALTPGSAPQQQITARRNLGVVYLRLGELSDGEASSDHFEKGVKLLKSALDAQDPAYQPLDWAITQQNLCLALYQHGARLGSLGASFVRDAKRRCADAVDRLSPESAPLDWAMAQNNLAAATAVLAQIDGDIEGLSSAIDAFTAAQTVYTRDRLPENWAEVELNRGELACNLAVLKGEPEELDRALAHLDSALEIFIETGNARYRQYAENLSTSINACARDHVQQCACGS